MDEHTTTPAERCVALASSIRGLSSLPQLKQHAPDLLKEAVSIIEDQGYLLEDVQKRIEALEAASRPAPQYRPPGA